VPGLVPGASLAPATGQIIVRTIIWLTCCVLTAGVQGGAVSAQQAPPPAQQVRRLTLAAAVDAAWQRASQAREAEGQHRRAQADEALASRLWAAPPAVELAHRDNNRPGAGAVRETELGLAWPLWVPGERSARLAAAQADVQWSMAAREVARLRLAGEVREAAWALQLLQAEAGQAQSQLSSLQGLAEDVERRVRSGELARADALAARADAWAAAAQQAEAQQRLAAARGQWQVLTGDNAEPDLSVSSATQREAAAQGASHPEMRLAQLGVERARRRLDAALASRQDPPEITLSMRHDAAVTADAGRNSVGVALRWPFGVDGRHQPLTAVARSELDVAQAHEQQLMQRHTAAVSIAQTEVSVAEQQLTLQRQRAEALRERARLIDKSFRSGEAPLPDLLRALAAAGQADVAWNRQQAALGLARARLQQTLGVLP
jgi:outer membrane protein, heavy metal efflux system